MATGPDDVRFQETGNRGGPANSTRVTQTGHRCLARPTLRRDDPFPKVRDIRSQVLSYVIRG
jgi:hypothetical protein